MGLLRKGAAVVLSVVVVVGVLFGAGVVGVPSASIEDVGDWGEVTEEETEVITTVAVQNPNPVGLNAGNLEADYRIRMNGVAVAEGQKEGVNISSGTSTVELSTYIQNEKLQPWWVEYVQRNETITVSATGEATLGTPLGGATGQFPEQNRTMLNDSAPVITALSGAASEIEGDYTRGVTVAGQSVSAGYEIERAWAEWGSVSERETVVLISYRVHNPGDVPVPAVPDGLQVNVTMNDVEMFAGGADDMSPQDIDRDAVLAPGDTQRVTLAITMDNDRIDDWFRSHVRNGEQTDMEATFSMLFRSERADATFRLPADGPVAVNCEFQTAILVDDQETDTDCDPGRL